MLRQMSKKLRIVNFRAIKKTQTTAIKVVAQKLSSEISLPVGQVKKQLQKITVKNFNENTIIAQIKIMPFAPNLIKFKAKAYKGRRGNSRTQSKIGGVRVKVYGQTFEIARAFIAKNKKLVFMRTFETRSSLIALRGPSLRKQFSNYNRQLFERLFRDTVNERFQIEYDRAFDSVINRGGQ